MNRIYQVEDAAYRHTLGMLDELTIGLGMCRSYVSGSLSLIAERSLRM